MNKHSRPADGVRLDTKPLPRGGETVESSVHPFVDPEAARVLEDYADGVHEAVTKRLEGDQAA